MMALTAVGKESFLFCWPHAGVGGGEYRAVPGHGGRMRSALQSAGLSCTPENRLPLLHVRCPKWPLKLLCGSLIYAALRFLGCFMVSLITSWLLTQMTSVEGQALSSTLVRAEALRGSAKVTNIVHDGLVSWNRFSSPTAGLVVSSSSVPLYDWRTGFPAKLPQGCWARTG